MKMKCAIKFCVLAVIYTLVPRIVKCAPLLLLQDDITDQNYDKYVIFDILESALVKNAFNIHQLRTTFYSGELVLCLPVVYEIDCITESNNMSNINCSSSTNPFLWTYFDTETFAGRVLLFFTKNNLKSPLFAIRHKFCEYSQATCGITLYLKIDTFPILRGNISVESLISTALLIITKKLTNYAGYINGIPTEVGNEGGYSLKWNEKQEDEFRNNTRKSEIIIPATLIPIALCVGISGGLQVLQFLKKHTNDNKGVHVFYIFWSVQFVAILIDVIHSWYIPETLIVVLIPSITFIYSVIVVIWCDIRFKVPCNEFVSECWRIIMSVFATWNTFIMFIYIAYTLPWIILGFYLYPIKILVRISALLAAGLLIIGNFYIFLLYFEECIVKSKCIKICECIGGICFLIPLCFPSCCIFYFSNCRSRIRENNYQRLNETAGDNRESPSKCARLSKCVTRVLLNMCRNNWDAVAPFSKCVTAMLVLFCLGCMGYLLHHIIFVFTNDVREAIIELLHLIPLFVLSLGAYMIRQLVKLTPTARERPTPTARENPDGG